MAELVYRRETYNILGICMSIHKALGMRLKEANYKDAMEIDFAEWDIPFVREKKFHVAYKGHTLANPYFADFVVYDNIVIEVKSAKCIIDSHVAQTISYLAASGLKVALLINFGERSLTWKRIVL